MRAFEAAAGWRAFGVCVDVGLKSESASSLVRFSSTTAESKCG